MKVLAGICLGAWFLSTLAVAATGNAKGIVPATAYASSVALAIWVLAS